MLILNIGTFKYARIHSRKSFQKKISCKNFPSSASESSWINNSDLHKERSKLAEGLFLKKPSGWSNWPNDLRELFIQKFCTTSGLQTERLAKFNG